MENPMEQQANPEKMLGLSPAEEAFFSRPDRTPEEIAREERWKKLEAELEKGN